MQAILIQLSIVINFEYIAVSYHSPRLVSTEAKLQSHSEEECIQTS